MPRTRLYIIPVLLTVGLLLVGGGRRVAADEVELKNGMQLQGKSTPLHDLGLNSRGRRSRGPVPNFPLYMVDTGLARYFVPRRQVKTIKKDELNLVDSFPLKQIRRSRSVSIQEIGHFLKVQPFDELGRRQVIMVEAGGRKREVVQGVTELTPHYLRLEGLNFLWESGIATTSLPPDTLDKLLRKAINSDDPDHRMAVARFYLQAKLYRQAQRELVAIREKFPELAGNVDNVSLQLTQLQARQLLDELKLRQQAGQHQFVYESSLKFPVENVSGAIKRDVRELTAGYEQRRQQFDLCLASLKKLQNEISPAAKAAEVEPLRELIAGELNDSSLDRLTAFLQFVNAGGLPADEHMAMALSGWVIGSANAVTDLNAALELFKARGLAMEYLGVKTDGNRRDQIVEELRSMEGIDAERVAQMLPLLPVTVETPDIQPGRAFTVAVTAEGEEPAISYSVMLPPEYHFGRNYPMVVALRSQGRTTEQEIAWWGGSGEKQGQTQRHGYIVISPDYAKADAYLYDYSATAHHIVLESIRDACRRFQVDADRIFLSGHSMGGDAAFDIGMSHPDLFAGVIPISGVSDKYCHFYRDNARQLAFYVVGGQLDRNAPEKNSTDLMHMMRYGYDLIYAEYKGRGREGFYEEIHKLFDWMSRHRRTPLPLDIDVKTLRDGDGRFHWFEASGFPNHVTTIDWTKKKGRKKPMPLKAHISKGNGIRVQSKAERNTIWLSPDLMDFDKRVKVHFNGRPKWNEFIEPSMATILEDFRIRGDRQRIFWARMDF